ncbi:MAG: ethanolamine ammonia-lyase subunit EutC [Burkholderiaceae bacterium]
MTAPATDIAATSPAAVSAPVPDPWQTWQQQTPARIALGRSGISLPTREVLQFAADHANARDAIHTPLDLPDLLAQLGADGWPVVSVRSQANSRADYLRRPDWGRRLHEDSAADLAALQAAPVDVMFVVGDGLSALAVQRHAAPMLAACRSALDGRLSLGPVVVAQQARVALADEIGQLLRARLVVMLIGERPGLSSPDSLGLYMTYAPQVSCTDAQRNCISNIRPAGLSYAAAAGRFAWLALEAQRIGQTGVGLKDLSEPQPQQIGNK